MRKIEMLVVEDQDKHKSDVEKYLTERIEQGANISVDYAKTFQKAIEMIESGKYGAVISDVFYPASEGEPITNSGERMIDYLSERDIELVLCTSTYHHGDNTEPTWRRARNEGVPFVDLRVEERNGEGTTKDWNSAYGIAVISHCFEDMKNLPTTKSWAGAEIVDEEATAILYKSKFNREYGIQEEKFEELFRLVLYAKEEQGEKK
jgi:hypothetical protein